MLWYVTRGAGATTTLLLTASVVLGVGEVRLWRPGGAPRFAIAAMHRTVSLLAVAFLAIHIVTTLLDPFPHIGLLNAAVPFATDYRPLWMGLGTIASDLLVAVMLTSLIRRRVGFRAWRWVHWLAYACWPIAIVHGLGTGSDTKSTWMLVLALVCSVAVALAIASRLAGAGTARGARAGGAVAVVVSAIGLAIWLPAGPLASGWAQRSGTPVAVLAAFSPRPTLAAPRLARSAAADPLDRPFSAALAGRIRNGFSAGGTSVVALAMRLRGGPAAVLRIRLGGRALGDGGLRLQRSAVTLGPPGDPRRYAGRVESLRGTHLRTVVGSRDGRALRLRIDLSLASGTVSGQVSGTPAGGTRP